MIVAAPPLHERAPFVDMLRVYREAGTTPFSCPGHKRGRGAPEDLRALLGDQVFDCDVWFNTGAQDRLLRAAESFAAQVWGADRSFFLVNGSSSGNHAYLLAAVGPGDEIIVARDLHKSLLVGLILTGARPVYVTPRAHPELDVGLGISARDVAAALDRHPAARLVALVSPSYYGVSSDLHGVVAVAHARGVPVYVDEAWGPHLGFHPDLPGQRTGTVRIAAEERVLGRAPQDLDPGCPGKLASIRHAVPHRQCLLVVMTRLREREHPLGRPAGLDPGAQGPGEISGLLAVVGDLGRGRGLARHAEIAVLDPAAPRS